MNNKTVLLKESTLKFGQEISPNENLWTIFNDPSGPFDCIYNVPETYICNYCDFRTFLKVKYTEHVGIVHQLKKVDRESIIKNYICRGCRFDTFSQLLFLKHQLEEHILANSEKWCKCEQWFCISDKCKRKTKSQCNQTIRTCRRKDCFQCRHCSYITYTAQDLKRHNFVKHTPIEKIVWFRCELCAYKTRWKFYLKRHILCKHDTSQNSFFKCGQCSYRTMRQDRLRKHINVKHTASEDAVWFQCALCLTYKTRRRDTLRRHIKTVHETCGSGWLKCIKCSYKTRREDYLKIHLKAKHESLFCTIQM